MDTMTILDAHRCHLGEGPCYDPRTGTAWWVDILERQLFERSLADGTARLHDLPSWRAPSPRWTKPVISSPPSTALPARAE